MHICLECLGVSLASVLDTHPLAFSPFVLYIRLLRSDVGAPEQEFPDGAYFYVEHPDDQE